MLEKNAPLYPRYVRPCIKTIMQLCVVGWSRVFPFYHTFILPWSCRSFVSLRHHTVSYTLCGCCTKLWLFCHCQIPDLFGILALMVNIFENKKYYVKKPQQNGVIQYVWVTHFSALVRWKTKSLWVRPCNQTWKLKKRNRMWSFPDSNFISLLWLQM